MLNWLSRYAPAIAALEEEGPVGSLLDVGCGAHGLACVRPEQPFVGLEVAYHAEPVETMVPFRFEPGPLPFEDASFDTVLCLDALEHIPRPDRPGVIAELARVSAKRLLVACPGSSAQALDDLLRDRFATMGYADPSWLSEHYEHVLPTPAEVEGYVRAVEGFDARPVPMANGLLCTMLVVADMFEPHTVQAAAEYANSRAEWTKLLENARFGESFRVAWMLERVETREALVPADDLERGALAAARPGAELVRRTTAAAVPAGDGRLWLSADWEEPAVWMPPLGAYLETAPTDGSTCLCLDVTAPGTDVDFVASLVIEACGAIMGDATFGDIALVTDPAERAGAAAVSTPGDVIAALCAPIS